MHLVVPVAGGQFLIYWPASLTNNLLVTTTKVTLPNWVTASNAVTMDVNLVTSNQ